MFQFQFQDDYYKILNLNPKCSKKEIIQAYRRHALKWHPDRHRGKGDEEKKEADKKFREINDAY